MLRQATAAATSPTALAGRSRHRRAGQPGLNPLSVRLAASPRFRDWALGFPLTRPLARRRARALFDLMAGFVYTQVLSACVTLDLFGPLIAAPLTLPQLAQHIGLEETALHRLVSAAASLGLLAIDRRARVRLGPLGAALATDPGLLAMARHQALLYADLADPVALLRGRAEPTRLGAFWRHHDPATEAPYAALMAATQPMIAREVLRSLDLRAHAALLDAGGGTGAFARLAHHAAPALPITILDRAPVSATTPTLPPGLRRVAGSLFDPWPTGHSLVTLIRVLHDHDDTAAARILARAHQALPRDGTLAIAEPLAGRPGTEPVGAYFTLYLLAMGQGRPRRFSEYAALLRTAGFTSPRLHRSRAPLIASVITARRRP